MLNNFFKTTLRNLWKNKSHTGLNMVGLAIGIACAGLIFLWVENEVDYDSAYAKKDRVYWIKTNQTYSGVIRTFDVTPGPLAAAMKAEIPGVVNTCRMGYGNILFGLADKTIYQKGFYADSSLFSILTPSFIQGNAATAFTNRYSIVISESMSERFFGKGVNAIGKILQGDKKDNYTVSGVIKDWPSNTTLSFDWLIPFDVMFAQRPWLTRWGAYGILTMAELSPGADRQAISKQLEGMIVRKDPNAGAQPLLHSMSDWHLRSTFEGGKPVGGQIAYVRLFTIIAWIILLIACINFMNLATARSEKRAREVGVRKVLGAAKKTLVLQFIGEALLLSFAAVLIGMLLITLLMPLFNLLVENQLSPGFGKPLHALALLTIALVCGLVAGSYPALYLSSFNPIFVFKGIRMKNSGASFTRRGLVVVQFTISIVLIISTIIIYQQIQHIRNRDIGYDRYHLADMPLRGNMLKNYAAIKQDMLNTGLVENTALVNTESLYTSDNTTGYSWEGKDPKSILLMSYRTISPEYLSTMGLKLLSGRDFTDADTASASMTVIITQSLEKIMGKGSAVGKIIADGTDRYRVIGVVKDYVYGDWNAQSDPVLFFCSPTQAEYMYVRIKPGAGTEDVLAKMEAVLKKDNPGYPFEYFFVDQQYADRFKVEALTGKLSRIFASLAIFISCLGLFGLATYTAERRTKEIGVRKVLGAGVPRIALMLSKDFLQLVFLSALIAFPVAWYAMYRWLGGYTYRIIIHIWVFFAAGIAALLIALVTISFQSVRAGMTNPIKSLRTE